jgi:hypothetical protein
VVAESVRDRVGAGLRSAAHGILGASIVAAPWWAGVSRVAGMRVFAGLMTVSASCWLGSVVCSGKLKAIPGRAVLAVGFLLFCGWLVVLTGPHLSPDTFARKHFAALQTRWPASLPAQTQVEAMWVASGLLGIFLLVADPATSGLWRARHFAAMALVGGSVVVFGVVQAVVQAPAMFWSAEELPYAGRFFATFFEEGMGVGLVCLVWPLAAGGLIGRFGFSGVAGGRERGEMVVWSAVVIAGWLALAVMSSLLGVIISGVLAVVLGLWVLWRIPSMVLRSYAVPCGWVALACGVAVVGGALVVKRTPVFQSHWTRLQAALVADGAYATTPPDRRFQMRPEGFILSEDDPADSHFAATQRRKLLVTGLRMIPQSGLLGFGPGSWPWTYPHFTDDALLRTYYLPMQFVFHDFLQTVVEWGLLGTLAWAVLFAGALSAGLYRLRRYRAKGGRIGKKEGMIAGTLAGLLGVLICAWWYPPLQAPPVQLYVAVLLGILWSAGERRGWSLDEAEDVIPKTSAT